MAFRWPVPLASILASAALAGCAHQRPAVAAADAPLVEEGVITQIQGESLVVRTADRAPVAMPFDLAEDPEVIFDETAVGTGALIEGASVRVFYRGEGELPATVERIEILSGEEAAGVRARAARPGPPPDDEEEGVLAPRPSPAPESSPVP